MNGRKRGNERPAVSWLGRRRARRPLLNFRVLSVKRSHSNEGRGCFPSQGGHLSLCVSFGSSFTACSYTRPSASCWSVQLRRTCPYTGQTGQPTCGLRIHLSIPTQYPAPSTRKAEATLVVECPCVRRLSNQGGLRTGRSEAPGVQLVGWLTTWIWTVPPKGPNSVSLSSDKSDGRPNHPHPLSGRAVSQSPALSQASMAQRA